MNGTVREITPENVAALLDLPIGAFTETWQADAYTWAVRQSRWCDDYTEVE